MAKTDEDLELGIIRPLGEGSFGKVYLVTSTINPTENYAMKVISLAKATQQDRDDAANEAKLLSYIHHENIIYYVEAFEQNGYLCLLTEFCDGGDLAQELEKQNGVPLPENRIIQWLKHICCGLQYLHSRHILHRDLKTQNIFLTGPNKIAKLGDLGLAKVLENPNAKALTFCGSPYYMSPEMFLLKPYDSKSDIWALGVCVYEMTTLEKPFDAMLIQQLVSKIVHEQLPEMPSDLYSTELITVMEKMLQRDSENRPSAEEILKDPVFKITPKSSPVYRVTTPTSKPTPKTEPKSKITASKNPTSPRLNAFESSTYGKSFREVFQQARGITDSDSFTNSNELGELLTTLSQLYSQKRQKDDDGLSNILAATHIDVRIKTDTYCDKEKDLDKTVTKVKSMKGSSKSSTLTPQTAQGGLNILPPSIKDSFTELFEQQQRFHNRIRNVVVHTLTHVLPRESEDDVSKRPNPKTTGPASQEERDPEAILLHQITHLQQYCAAVLDEDILNQAYGMLNAFDDQKLEENLIRLMTPEKYALCGAQLLYCKNFEYSLAKLQGQVASGH